MQFVFPRVFASKLLKKQNFDKFSSKFLSNTYQPKANQEEIAGKLKGFYKLHLILTRNRFKMAIYNIELNVLKLTDSILKE
jgi:hypothetical protein